MKDEIQKLFEDFSKLWDNGVAVVKDKLKITETDLGMNKKKIQVELPAPPPSGGFACCPSGDCEYNEALEKWRKECNAIIVEAIPNGYSLKSSEVKKEEIVRHYADLVVEKNF